MMDASYFYLALAVATTALGYLAVASTSLLPL
jgi:hypothetical protein